MSYFYDLEKSGTVGVPKRVLHDTEHIFKTQKTRTVPGKPGLMEYLHMSEHNRAIISNLFKLRLGFMKILGAFHF
jgi:hypothetical protein